MKFIVVWLAGMIISPEDRLNWKIEFQVTKNGHTGTSFFNTAGIVDLLIKGGFRSYESCTITKLKG